MFYWLFLFAPLVPVCLLLFAFRRLLLTKRDDLRRYLSDAVGAKYTATFGRWDETFEAYYSPWAYLSALLALLFATSWLTLAALVQVGLPPVGLPATLSATLAGVPGTVFAAAGGAYLYGVWTMIARYATRDLFPSVLHRTWLGILVGAILGPLVATPVKAPGDLLVAFAIGAFPIKALWEWVQSKAPITTAKPLAPAQDWSALQGASSTLLDRLEGQGIDTIAALAVVEPVRLLLTTNLEWDFVLDLIDQSLLINYIGAGIEAIRPLGVRGAVEIATIDARLVASPPPGASPDAIATCARERAAAEAQVVDLARLLNVPETGVRNLCWQVNNDPLVEFIWTCWTADGVNGDDDTEHPLQS